MLKEQQVPLTAECPSRPHTKVSVERISSVYMGVALASNKSDGLWLRQQIGGETSRRRRTSGIGPGMGRFPQEDDETDTWYLSAGCSKSLCGDACPGFV